MTNARIKAGDSQTMTILIVGGGTAGWLTANLMQRAWHDRDIDIVVVESASIGTVGVGEGTTPFIRDAFRRLDIPEREWMPACNATFKCGISFPQWSTKAGFETYFHPFYSELDSELALKFFDNCNYRRQKHDVPAHPDDYFVTSKLAQQMRSPIPKEPLPFNHDYGYHFDAALLGQFLREKGTQRGVRHVEDTIISVERKENGDIALVSTEQHGSISADYFVDCSGLRGLLIQNVLEEPLICYRKYLPNDSAVALPTPLKDTENVPSETVSRALGYGWVWRIPLMSRMGNGYVYASDYTSEDDAETEIRDCLGTDGDSGDALHLHWKPGRINRHWRNNCVAIGLSQGFLEPLEAAMLHVIQFSAESFIAQFEGAEFTAENRDTFNSDVNRLIDGIRDYLQLHYILNTRDDTDYWRDNRERLCMTDNVSEILTAWDSGASFDEVMARQQQHQVYKKTSWYCMLAGMGRYPASTKKPRGSPREYIKWLDKACSNKAAEFHPHGDYLSKLYAGNELRIA